jgi:glucans biosynthesis protein
VRGLARALSQKSYQNPDTKLPSTLATLTYDQYRSIRFDPQHALWSNGPGKFRVEFFHRGFFYKERVDIFVVDKSRATPVPYSAKDFTFNLVPRPASDDLGFAGFRIHYPLNRSDYYDEICAFLGASYFRAVAKGQGYGLSARGLAINTASPSGEEFPLFKSFWIETPPADSDSIVVHALLDSRSAAAAFRFTIRPGEQTIFDTEAAIYPRLDMAESGIAPLTSMFYFDAHDRSGIDDYRTAVHDSEGLLMRNGHNEQIWRPLTNPKDLQVSVFSDVNPRGFGLLQRRRAFFDYEDLEARYERRPSLLVEPIGDWGEGSVNLIEIPAQQEIHDNIVSFWRPKEPLHAHEEYLINYRLHWCWSNPEKSDLAEAVSTRSGVGSTPNSRLFVIDFAGDGLKALPKDRVPRADVRASKGKVQDIVTQLNTERAGWRLSFELVPEDEKLIELQARLLAPDPVSEIWLYRWQP